MTITPEQIGQRLRSAREAQRLTQDAIAAELGLPRSAISLMESGQRQLSTLELTRLAALYGRSMDWFVRPNVPLEQDDPVVALFRAEEGLQGAQVQTQATRCLRLFHDGATLSRLLGRDRAAILPRYELPEARSVGQAIAQGHRVADQERRRLDLGIAPVRDLPESIGAQGLWVAGLGLPAEISGLFLKSPDFGMAILVNTTHAPVRRRFSYAHEYGHALMDRDAPPEVTSTHNAKTRSEQRANAFAAAFLMPADGVRDFMHALGKGRGTRREEAAIDAVTEEGIFGELRSPPRSQTITFADVALLSRHFGASYPAAVWRLRGLAMINAEETDALIKQTDDANRYLRAVRDFADVDDTGPAGGAAGPAEEHRDHALDGQVLPLALEAWRRGEISESRLVEIGQALGIDEDVMLDLGDSVRRR